MTEVISVLRRNAGTGHSPELCAALRSLSLTKTHVQAHYEYADLVNGADDPLLSE